jgi:hypothetical protein
MFVILQKLNRHCQNAGSALLVCILNLSYIQFQWDYNVGFQKGVLGVSLRAGLSLQVLVPRKAALRAFRYYPSRGV